MNLVKRNFPFLFILSLLLLFIFISYKDYGIAWDEKVYLQVGRHYLIQIFNLLGIKNNLQDVHPFLHGGVHLKTHGVFFDLVIVLTSLVFKNFNFELYHLLKALYSIFIFVFLYLITNKFMDKKFALISLFFLFSLPRFITDMFVNSIDMPTTIFFSLAVYYFFFFLKSKRGIFQFLLFGLFMALIINQRAVFWYFFFTNLLFLAYHDYYLKKKGVVIILTTSFFLLIFTIFFMHLTHPYIFNHPISGIYDIIQEARHGYPFGAAVLFEGKWYQAGSNPLPWHFLPKSIIISTPLFLIALFFLGNLKLLLDLILRHSEDNKKIKSWVLGYFLAIFYTPIILVLLLKPTLYDSWRQFLFLAIPMIVISVYGLSWILETKNKIFKTVMIILICLNLIATWVEIKRLHPLEYVYYNELVGGLPGAFNNYETDYLGVSYKEAVLWFNKNVNKSNQNYKILVEGDPLSSSYYFKPNMRLTTDVNEADYIFTFTRWNFHNRHPGKTIYTVKREDIPLIFIKEL